MQKKHLMLLIVFNIFLVIVGCSIVWTFNNRAIGLFKTSMEFTMGNTVDDIKHSNLLSIQSYLVDTIAVAKKSVVSITISKDVKFYLDDPTQLYGPGNIQQQTTTLGGGSGIIVSKKGYILTNKHVVQDTSAKYAVVLHDGTIYNVDKVRFDDVLDLALLKISDSAMNVPDNLMAIKFLPLKNNIEIGQFVFSIGNTLSKYPHTVTMGIVGSRNKELTINGNNLYVGLYQTDAQSNPGNSGGPLIDIGGNAIGIITAIVEGEGMSFALPISQEFVDSTIVSLEKFGKIARPILGVQYTEITPSLQKEKQLTADSGIYLTDVLIDLPAWEAGLKIGDSIIGINGKAIDTHTPFLYQLYTHIPGETIVLDVIRDTIGSKISVVLGGNIQ